jgi:hypothetical protein
MMQCGKILLKRNIFMAKTQFIGLLAFTDQVGKMPGEVPGNLQERSRAALRARPNAYLTSAETPRCMQRDCGS